MMRKTSSFLKFLLMSDFFGFKTLHTSIYRRFSLTRGNGLTSILLFFFLSFSAIAFAQKKEPCKDELKGIVLDVDTKEALPYVQVRIKDTQQYSLTNSQGRFTLNNVCDESSTLIVSYLGYVETTLQYSRKRNNAPIYLKQDTQTLETVNVTGEKSKAEGTVTVSQIELNKEVLSADPTKSLASALAAIDGVTFASIGSNVQLPVIHGLYGNRILILNNGLKHGFQNWGNDHAPEIDVSTANNVTVVKGAAGVRYGPEALGGAIIVEADPLQLNKPLKAQVGTGYQTNGRGYFANGRIAQGLKNWSYHVGANYTKIGDRHAPDYSLTNTGKVEKSFNAGMRYNLGDLDFKVYYSFVDQNLAVLRSSFARSGDALVRAFNAEEPSIIKPFAYDINEPNQVAQHHLGKVELNWWYADDAKLTLRYGKQLNHREEYDVRRNADRPIINLDLITDDVQLEWKHSNWFNLDGLVGFQFFSQNNDNNPGTSTTPFVPNYNTLRFSTFIVESLEMNANTFELGVRFDYESNDVRGRDLRQDVFRDAYSFTNVTSSLGYIRQVSESSTFRTNLGLAWRTPNMAELYSFGQHGFRITYGLLRYYTNEANALRTDRVLTLAESDVLPERGYKWINEWRTQKQTNTVTFTAYSHYIENFIFTKPIGVFSTFSGPSAAFIYDQTDALFIGADFTWQKEWSQSLNGTMGLSYLWARDLSENDPLINQPPITTSYELQWKTKPFFGLETSQLSVKPSYMFEQFQAPRTVRPEEIIEGSVVITPESEIFDFMDAPPGYFLVDFDWKFKWKTINVSLSVHNVFNARYRNYLNEMRYFADEPGRNFLFTINYMFNSN